MFYSIIVFYSIATTKEAKSIVLTMKYTWKFCRKASHATFVLQDGSRMDKFSIEVPVGGGVDTKGFRGVLRTWLACLPLTLMVTGSIRANGTEFLFRDTKSA